MAFLFLGANQPSFAFHRRESYHLVNTMHSFLFLFDRIIVLTLYFGYPLKRMKMSIFVNNTFPRRSLSRLAGVCAALLLLTACGAPAAGGGSVPRGQLTLEWV